ncbi:MAG: signal peptidase I, partial [Lentisphaerae bacterium RIFOXYA12_FULL_60_10]
RVESISMEPTLIEDDFVLVYRLAYSLGEPERGDVVVFQYPPETNQVPYIKRIIGLPGDTIKVEAGQVFINGQPLEEPYLKVPTNRGGEWVVPLGSIFVMGDNRNNSSDSRVFGPVPIEDVMGKALVVYFPPEHWQMMTGAFDDAGAEDPGAAATASTP